MHTYVFVCMYACMRVCVCMCMCVCACVCVCVCVFVFVVCSACGPGHNIRMCLGLCYRSSKCGPEKAFCLPAAPHTVALCYYLFFLIVLGIVFLLLLSLDAHNHVDDYTGTLGGRKVHISAHFIFHISSHTPFLSHTINISNDQTLILNIIGRRRRLQN